MQKSELSFVSCSQWVIRILQRRGVWFAVNNSWKHLCACKSWTRPIIIWRGETALSRFFDIDVVSAAVHFITAEVSVFLKAWVDTASPSLKHSCTNYSRNLVGLHKRDIFGQLYAPFISALLSINFSWNDWKSSDRGNLLQISGPIKSHVRSILTLIPNVCNEPQSDYDSPGELFSLDFSSISSPLRLSRISTNGLHLRPLGW